MNPIPYPVLEAMVQCFGRCFWYKDNMAAFLQGCGVSQALANRDRALAKFVWGRNILTELVQTDDGKLVQRRILTEFCKLRDLPDKEVPDRDAGLRALRELKRLALEHDLIAREEIDKGDDRKRQGAERAKLAQERAEKLEGLRRRFF